MFKLNYDYKELDWSKANIFEFKYIWYLARMIQERYIGLGILPLISWPKSSNYIEDNDVTGSLSTTWNISRFSPNGILSWEQMQMIYNSTMYLGLYVYYKDGNLSSSNYKDGQNRKWLRIFFTRYV